MPLKRVYLDQRDWITLARQHYGRTNDKEIADVLDLVREASARGYASFPLSASHYIETARQRNPGPRQRLGTFMADISRYHSIASAPDLLEAEVHVALCAKVGLNPAKQPKPFGLGAAHAFNADNFSYFTDPDLEKRAIAHLGSDAVFDYFERALLTGPAKQLPADGIALPSREFDQRQLEFEHETTKRLQQWGHNSDRAHRLVITQEGKDVAELVDKEAATTGIDMWSYVTSSRQALFDFMLALPAKGAICRLRMSGHEDQCFRWHIGDLSDITALGTAAGYCDVVVAEKHWGGILRRHAPHFRAKITTSLRDLPQLLLG